MGGCQAAVKEKGPGEMVFLGGGTAVILAIIHLGGSQALSICWHSSLRKGRLKQKMKTQGRRLEREPDG